MASRQDNVGGPSGTHWHVELLCPKGIVCPTLTDERSPARLWSMDNEFTAIVERDGRWFIAWCPEIPGANGQGETRAEALDSLRDAISLVLEDRREDGLRGVPDDAERHVLRVS